MQQMSAEERKALEEKLKNMSPEELKEFQKQQCIFCQIIAGKVPSKKVYEDDQCLAVMDINPAAPGHLLLMPKEHYAIMPQIPDEVIGHLFAVTKHLSQSMLRKLRVEGTSVFVANGMAAGQRSQHFMVHIIPRKEEDGLLDVPEHLVELGLRESLAVKIENRMNQLMGIKKIRQKTLAEEKETEKKAERQAAEKGKPGVVQEVQAEPKQKDKQEEQAEEGTGAEKEEVSAPQKEKALARGTEKQKRNGTAEEPEEETEEPEEAQQRQTEESKDKPDKEEDDEKDKEDEEKGGPGVSLDDIADLFK